MPGPEQYRINFEGEPEEPSSGASDEPEKTIVDPVTGKPVQIKEDDDPSSPSGSDRSGWY